MLVLEELEHAHARGARIYAEFVGYGATGDAYHMTAPRRTARARRAACAWRSATPASTPEQIDYINAHGTSTPFNDTIETKAIKAVFGEHARRVPVSSTKSMTGHLLGAAGGVEAIASVLAIERGVIPPTINLEHPDPECDLDYVPNTARRAAVRDVLSNTFGFGGTNASVVFKKVRALSQPGDHSALEERIGYRFRRPELLATALTHRSVAAERPAGEAEDNERLEFVGDAVLGLAAARHLAEEHPAAREGELTRMRAALVGEPALATAARDLGLGERLRFGRGEERSGGREKPSILAGALEALVGAVFLDGGWRSAYRLCRAIFRGPAGSAIAAGRPATRRRGSRSCARSVTARRRSTRSSSRPARRTGRVSSPRRSSAGGCSAAARAGAARAPSRRQRPRPSRPSGRSHGRGANHEKSAHTQPDAATRGALPSSPSSGGRTSASPRSSTASCGGARPSSTTSRGSRATASTPTRSGTGCPSRWWTPAASTCSPKTRWRSRSATRPPPRSRTPTSRFSSPTPWRG